MKKICFFSLVIVATAFFKIFGSQIYTYQELTSAMQAAKHFVILVDLEQCVGKPGMGYFIPKSMLLMPKTETSLERVMTSDLHFTDCSGKPSYEYIKYTFYSDKTVVIRTILYDPQDFKTIGPERTINCILGQGVEVHIDK